ISTADGQVSLSLDGQLPPNWPSSFPLPQGAKPAGSGSLGGESTTGVVAVFQTSQSPQDVYSYYTDQARLTVESKSSVGGDKTFVGTVQFSGSPSGRVTILPRDDQTLILVTLTTGGSETGTTAPRTSTSSTTPTSSTH